MWIFFNETSYLYGLWRGILPDGLEQHQSWGGTMPCVDRFWTWTNAAVNIWLAICSSQWRRKTVGIDDKRVPLQGRCGQNERMMLKQRPSKVVLLQIAITSTVPFLPAISEDFVFDDLPAIARNNDLVAASPVPIFLVNTNTFIWV